VSEKRSRRDRSFSRLPAPATTRSRSTSSSTRRGWTPARTVRF